MAPEPHWLEQRLKDLFPHATGKPHETSGVGTEPSAVNGDMTRYTVAALSGVINDLRKSTEGNRNDTLNKSAYRLGRFVGGGHLDETTARVQLEHAGRVCGLGESEIAKTIQSGLVAGIAEPFTLNGNDYRPPIPAPTVGPSLPDAASLPTPVDWQTVLTDDMPDTDWLIPEIVERGRLYALFAPSKTHKSLIVQYLAAELCQTANVVYLDMENSQADLRLRYRAMGYRPATAHRLSNLHYFSFPSLRALDTPMGGAGIVELAEMYCPELVVIDTTSRVISGKENDSDTFGALYRYAMMPLKAMGVAVLRIDHAGKDVTLGQRGSSAKGDDVDTVWLLIKHDEDTFSLKCDRQRSGNHPEVIHLTKCLDPLRFERIGDIAKGPLTIDGIIRELDKLNAPNAMGWNKAYELLDKAGKHATQAQCREACSFRQLRFDDTPDPRRTSQLAGQLAPFSARSTGPVSEPVSSEDPQSIKADQTPVSTDQLGLTDLTGGEGRGPVSYVGGAICPPTNWPPDTDPPGAPSYVDKTERKAMELLVKGGVKIKACPKRPNG